MSQPSRAQCMNHISRSCIIYSLMNKPGLPGLAKNRVEIRTQQPAFVIITHVECPGDVIPTYRR